MWCLKIFSKYTQPPITQEEQKFAQLFPHTCQTLLAAQETKYCNISHPSSKDVPYHRRWGISLDSFCWTVSAWNLITSIHNGWPDLDLRWTYSTDEVAKFANRVVECPIGHFLPNNQNKCNNLQQWTYKTG